MLRHFLAILAAVALAILVLVLPDILEFFKIDLSSSLISSVVMAVLVGYFAGLVVSS